MRPEGSEGLRLAAKIIRDGQRIEREKNGRALTPDEVRTVKAGAFISKIAPYLVEPDDA